MKRSGNRQTHRDFGFDWLHEWREPDGEATLQLARLPERPACDGARMLRAPGLCDFYVFPETTTVEADARSDIDPQTLEHLLIDQALPRLLAQCGHLMVHASQVQVGWGTALFLGRSGWGKSTLAGLFHQRGHPALSDDCVELEVRDGTPFGTPSYPGLRLYEDSIAQMRNVAQSLSPVADYSAKQRVIGLSIPQEQMTTQRIRAIYVLGDPGSSRREFGIRLLSRGSACMAVVEHSFRLDPTARDQSERFLRQSAAITAFAPTFSLEFPHDFSRQNELVSSIVDHLDSIAPHKS